MATPADSWREEFLCALHSGLSKTESARRAGVDPSRVNQVRRADPAFDRAVRFSADQHRRRRIDVLCQALHEGESLPEAADHAGIPVPTLRRWRRTDVDLDARILAAAAQGGQRLGGRTGMRPAAALTCPGARCGTSTGYDYGCREAACTTAKTAPLLTRRQEAPDER